MFLQPRAAGPGRRAAQPASPLLLSGALQLAPLLVVPLLLVPLLATPAAAHHLMETFDLKEGPLAGLLSGIGHPLLGPDHLLFLLALGLVGLVQRLRWVLALLAVGLTATGLGLMLPALPGAEALVALSLVVVGLVVIQRLPVWTLLPAFALHGYVLSDAVSGWQPASVVWYLLGLLISQGALLWLALTLVQRWRAGLAPARLMLAAGVLIGVGSTFAWSALVP
jgi:urease accessory protein